MPLATSWAYTLNFGLFYIAHMFPIATAYSLFVLKRIV
jgi:hypothetical protein